MSEAKKDDNNDGNNSEDPQGNAAEGILYNENKCIWVGYHEQLFEDFLIVLVKVIFPSKIRHSLYH